MVRNNKDAPSYNNANNFCHITRFVMQLRYPLLHGYLLCKRLGTGYASRISFMSIKGLWNFKYLAKTQKLDWSFI